MIKAFRYLTYRRNRDSLLKLTIPLVTILKLDPELSNLHEGQNVWNPLDHEWRRFLLLWGGLTNLEIQILINVFLNLPSLANNYPITALSG